MSGAGGAARLIRRVLIANRGEIAVRIQRTCSRLGIETVAVYSHADRALPFVANADQAFCLGASEPPESYLNQPLLVDLARRSGADAVHPGYGFLAENAAFAGRVREAGLRFVGPSTRVLEQAGSKQQAKACAKAAGVPVVPGFSGLEAGVVGGVIASDEAESLTYPVLVKASAGGGGRGMRVVHRADELAGALLAASREAQAAFGDGTLLLERYLTDVRHVEVQILGDEHGNVVHLFERDCSVQRRHQKLIEETPAPGLSESTRLGLRDAAVSLGRALSYSGAGTVEFVVDADGNFFFLEINARLQVEHGVTELTTGVDIVEQQLRVAEGRALSLSQEELRQRGAAIEVRLCAEDPDNGHLPTIGRLLRWDLPPGLARELPRSPRAETVALRVDAGTEVGCDVGLYYDSMLAKVLAWGETRDDARRRLIHALRQVRVHGVITNRDWLWAVLEHPTFVAAAATTDFVASQEEGAPVADAAGEEDAVGGGGRDCERACLGHGAPLGPGAVRGAARVFARLADGNRTWGDAAVGA